MNKKILIHFLKDHLLFTFALYSSAVLIITFFWLQTDESIEVIYPLILVSFVYLIFMIIRAYRYIAFHQLIENANGRFDDVSIKGITCTEEQRMVIGKIKKMEDASLANVNQLEMQNEMKYKIISHIIHNIKTPTSVIDLMIQYSQTEKTNAHDIMTKINKQNQLINEHLDQALHYLRLDYFQHDFFIEKTDLIQQLREMINEKKEQFIYHHVFPQWNIDVDHIYVLTDKKWNKILLEQLISNAIKYTALKTGEKEVSFHVQCKKDRVLLFIEDTGIGIPEYDLKRVCEPFFTGENGRKIRHASGIGLYLSKSISDRMNHQMTISSKAGQGTNVMLTYLTKV